MQKKENKKKKDYQTWMSLKKVLHNRAEVVYKIVIANQNKKSSALVDRRGSSSVAAMILYKV